MRFWGFLTLFLVVEFCHGVSYESLLHPLSEQFINVLNQRDLTWKAGRNFHPETSMKYIRRLMGVLPNSHLLMPPTIKHSIPEHFKFPENFDARQNWSHCPTISEIRDQGSCGSCWAISSVEVMSDRTCINSKGLKNFHYSTEDLMSCCHKCGFGCKGGSPGGAFEYWVKSGIVSGGLYNSSQGCVPYEIAPCEHHIDGPRPNCTEGGVTPTCRKSCEKGYSVPYDQDLHRGKDSYSVEGVHDIMYELIKNGPVAAGLIVFTDFLHYKSGVYSNAYGMVLGEHEIRILGYGVEDGTPYWLCANSWNTDWGDNGFFKILRGSNESGIEADIIAGTPM
ncbi:UNVERIFIED_CONTAM: hypothetical protein GTU68_064720 [Idotea baltica]|nr:hypothetical protein [Idotea baltica]